MPKSFISRVLLALLLTITPTFAQSLADVLSSIQERKQAIEQSKQVSWHLNQNYSASPPGGNLPEQILIEWQGLGSVKFPSDSDTAGLGIDARIELLNQAIKELRSVQRSYLNFRKQDLISGAQAGVLRPFMLEDFPDAGRAGAENYHRVLQLTAQSVRRLSVLPWPIAGNERSTYVDASSVTPIAAIGAGALEEEQPGWIIGNSEQFQEESTITSTIDHEAGEDDEYFVSKSEKFYDKFALFAAVPQVTDQLQGKVAAIARNNWTNVPDTSVNVSAPATWKAGQNGACIVTLAEDNPSGDFASAGTPQITVQLAWASYQSNQPFLPFPAGTSIDNNGDYGVNSWELLFGTGGYAASPPWDQKQLVLSRRITGVFAPTFSKGLDASGKAAALDQSERATAGTPGDAQPVLHPTTGMLMGIPLGCSLDGASMGWIGITPGETDNNLIRYSSEMILTDGSTPDVNPYPWELAHRFDYSASLRFIGPAQDFHVVYETSREAAKRGATLPAEIPTSQETTDMGNRFFFRNWDLPRLKQVVSRDFIVNITPQGHYKNLVEIYRRPANAGAVDRTPGLVLEVGEAIPFRTLTLENPDAANDPYPATPEKLLIIDGDTTYKIERTGYPAYAEKSPGSYGVSHPDLSFEIKEGETVRYSKNMDFQGIGHVITTTTLEGATSTETINDQDWSWYLGMVPSNRSILRGTQTTTVANTFVANPAQWPPSSARYAWYPLTSEITITNEPNTNLTWNASGRLVSAVQGSWKSEYSIDGGAIKGESKFNDTTFATTWTEWSNNDRAIKTYSAPDGSVTSKDAAAANWTEIELGNASGTGLPGLPHKLTNKDGSGAKWTWTVSNDFSGLLVYESGQLTSGSLTNGQKQTTTWNKRSYTITSLSESVIGGVSTVAGSSTVPEEETTAWGAPKKWLDHRDLFTLISYDGQFNRATSVISPLGLTTNYSNYDIFYRPGQIESNNITANHTYTGLGVSTTYGGTGVTAGSQSSFSQNAEGTTITANVTWGGVTQSSATARGTSNTTITGSHSLLGSSGATLRKDDGSLSTATGSTLAFGGIAGDALSIVNGLFVTKTAVAEVPGTFAETHTDAWGRTHKVVTPSKSSGTAQTTFNYSLPASTIKRAITTEPSGRKMITESDIVAMISRSGIDVNGNGELGASDRCTQSTTEIENGNIVTTLTVTEDSGMREVLETTYTPATGVTITKINGNEETITQNLSFPTQPPLLYPTKTTTITSSKGWSRVEKCNNLGLPIDNVLTGTGIPATSLNPVWRADGTLANVSLTIGGETHTAGFNPDNTLASLTAPGRGNILGQHSISNGVESMTVNGKTVQRKMDGTEKSTSGANVIAKDETLTAVGGNYKKAVVPAVGAATETALNAAFAPTSKTYADNTGESYGYTSELLTSIGLARGGALVLAYSNDGAKDLTAATWPAMTSGALAVPAIGHSYEYNRSGQVKTQTDPSGTRSLTYHKGRLNGSLYTAGVLKGYQIVPVRDEFGRQTATLLKRDGNTIHSIALALNGASDQIINLGSGEITATPQRNAAGNIIGYIWSDGTNSVTQTWTRGAGGRIEKAESDVAGAPSFDYLIDANEPAESFDAFGRRLKCETAGGRWVYTYGEGGQLSSAIHPTLGTFTYSFDGIGRRTDKGEANTTDILNRTTAWIHNQNKTLSIKAHPDARVWFNGVEIENFNGTHNATITPPGANGGWVPWETLAIMEEAGEGAGNPAANPLADPDAKSEKRGAVWVPPAAETFTFDAAGNRQSSAQFDYGWDAKNQLARVRTKNHTTAAQAYDISFTYDSEGRRIKKHVIEFQNGAVVSEKIITFIWDGWDLLYERHQLPSGLTLLERKYLWGPDIADGAAGGAGGLLLIKETKGSVTTAIIPLYDGTGHVCALTDINKNLLATYAYGPFGEKISATGPKSNSNPWRFQTKYLDEETGLYYFGHRYYDPTTCQFISRDLMGEDEDPNLYRMTGGDPINHVDVHGLAKVPLNQADKNLIELALRYGLIDQDGGEGVVIDTAVLNSLLIANGETPVLFQDGRTDVPCIVCHGKTSTGPIPGVSRLYSMVNGQVHSSSGNGDMMRKIGAGAWGNTRAIIPEIGNLLTTIGNGSANAVGEFIGVEIGSHPAFYQTPFDADGQRSAGQQQVYPGISGDNLLVGSGGALADAVLLFAGPEALAKGFSLGARAPGWSVKLAPKINPQLAMRLEAFSAWKARKGYDTVTSAQFRRFMGGHRPNSAGATFYGDKSGFAAWSRRVDSVHGNMAGSQTAWLYRLETSSGDFLKWGIAADPATRYSTSFMRGKELIPIQMGPRSNILSIERRLVESYPGPLNLEPWAGSNNLFWQNIGK